MLKPKALDHVALKVTDMDKSLAFYHDVLGLELLRTSVSTESGGRAAVLQIGSQKLDLFSRPDFVSADKDNPIGMDHLCVQLEAAAIEDVIDTLHQQQVEIFWGPVVRQGTTSVYVYDPDGIHVELRVATPASTTQPASQR